MNFSVSPSPMCRSLTKVDIVVSSSLSVHLIDEEAGHRLQEQAEYRHAHAEAKRVPVPLCQNLIKDSKVDNVCQDGHKHPQKELMGKVGG